VPTCEFPLAEETRIGRVSEDWDGLDLIDDTRTKLSRLQLDEQFAYVFDLGDSWEHLCTVGPERVDPLEVYGIMRLTGPSPTSAGAPSPTSTAGAGTAMTANPRCLQRRSDLPPILHGWGSPRGIGGYLAAPLPAICGPAGLPLPAAIRGLPHNCFALIAGDAERGTAPAAERP
jgi:hypothetical protein